VKENLEVNIKRKTINKINIRITLKRHC